MPNRAPGGEIDDVRRQLARSDPTFVRWRPERAEQHPELVDAVAQFDAGGKPAAVAAAEWLRDRALLEPLESATRLCVVEMEVVGFYALANGAVVMRSNQRRQLGTQYPTQPAVIVTWIAKSARHEFDGNLLVEHAIGAARQVARDSAATVLGLDPFDAETAEMWRSRYGFKNSASTGPGGDLRRMFLPLRTDEP
jgi:hypothetical protein